ncbi:MAG: radical SAM protein [Candidatus Hermodarchaeota archaeon]
MTNNLIYIDKSSQIPLKGVDFIGVVDRGTNVIEIKPLTLCNLKCKYCFVSAGDYETNFLINSDYLVEEIRKAIVIKGNYDIEIHFAPYGEILLYSELYKLIYRLWEIEGIKTISMQTNGLLLSEKIIKKLSNLKLTRINISLNSLDKEKANYLCACNQYNVKKLVESIHILLNSEVNVLIAPVWFPKQNDKDIEDIIRFVINLRKMGFSEKKVQIGIQKYLIYKTGRKLKKIRPKSWDYFYNQLTRLENKYKIKLKLGPADFGIHQRLGISNINLKKHDTIELEIVSKGRWNRECIGRIDENYGIKVLLKKPFIYSDELLNKTIKAKIIKANYKDNIFTASFPI